MKKIILVTFILAILMLTAVPPAVLADTGSVYNDISGKWFTGAVTKYGYPEIFSDGNWKFNPDKAITHIEFVRLLHKALGINVNYFVAPDVKDYFDDMANTDTGAYELIDMATTGIIDNDSSFNPNMPLDRDLMIHWIMSALKYEADGNYSIPTVKPVPFSDDTEISDAYRSEIYSSVVLNLVHGRGNNLLLPKDSATRAEAVTIVSNLMVLLDSYKSVVRISASAWLMKEGSLTMSLTIRNNTDKAATITHMSGQKYDFKLFDAEGNNLYTWSADKMFMALVSKTEIGPGAEIVFSDTLNSEDYGGIKQAVFMKAYITGASDDFTIDANGYAAIIVK